VKRNEAAKTRRQETETDYIRSGHEDGGYTRAVPYAVRERDDRRHRTGLKSSREKASHRIGVVACNTALMILR
jgi:hypothetical protein